MFKNLITWLKSKKKPTVPGFADVEWRYVSDCLTYDFRVIYYESTDGKWFCSRRIWSDGESADDYLIYPA